MNKSKSVKTNIIYSMLYQVVALALPLLTTPYISRVLGADQVGEYSYAVALASYFVIAATLGSSTYGRKIIAFYQNDRMLLSEKFWNLVSFRIFSTTVFFTLYFLYLIFFDGITAVKASTGIYILNVAIDITWLYQGLEDFRKTITRGLIVKILSFLLVFLFIKSVNDTWKYTCIVYGSVIVGNITLWRGVSKNVDKPNSIHVFNGIKDMWLVFLPTIASQVYTVLDKSMIGWITHSNYQNGCYEQSEKLVRTVIVSITSVSSVILSRVANLYYNNRMEEAKIYVYKTYRLVLMLALPAMFGLSSIASLLIPVYLGDGYDLGIILLIIFSALLIFVSLASITGLAYLVPTNQQNVYTISVTIAAGVNFTVNLIVIPKYGAIGAAIASVLAEFIGVAIQIGFCVATNQLHLRKIFLPSWKYLIASIIMFTGVSALKRYLSLNLPSLVILIIAGVIVYFVCLLILRDELFSTSVKKIMKKFQSRLMK